MQWAFQLQKILIALIAMVVLCSSIGFKVNYNLGENSLKWSSLRVFIKTEPQFQMLYLLPEAR
ncbi:hypothetical protein [Brackiella oedipodis]|uniref:hypothetical protein n=1 Tax=Brackiella oedipodis TaxID=124225 RepID=UPI00048FBFBD|nr:hypothetical protein [Brackiella oedipodis]